MRLIIEILLMGLAVFLGARLIPGVAVEGYGTAIIAALLIALANATIGFILRLLTFPINFLTLIGINVIRDYSVNDHVGIEHYEWI